MLQVIRCDECHVTVMAVQNGALVVKVKHHGETHTTVIPLTALIDKASVLAIG